MKGTIETKASIRFLVCKGLTIDEDVGVSRDTVFQKIRPGVGLSNPAISLKKKIGRGLPWNDSLFFIGVGTSSNERIAPATIAGEPRGET